MDIERSFKNLKTISPEAVISILRAYALHDPKIGYCQGMNFVAGFLYLITKNEAMAFSILCGIIKRLGMQKIYSENVPLLRCRFYQMDRILHSLMPKLAEHFRVQGANASLYCSSWIITLFSMSIESIGNNSENEKPSDFIMAIWDAIIAQGWKNLFRAGIFLLQKYENVLMGLKFEKILHFIAEIPKTEIWNKKETAIEFKEKTKSIKISNSMLETLENEYQEIFDGDNNKNK